MKMDINKREWKLSSIKQWRLFVIGIIFFVLGITLHNAFNSVSLEILSIIGSFAVWEAANIILLEKPQNKVEHIKLEKLLETEILISDNNLENAK